jgi:SAM-dependent methyltransferase
VDTVESWRGGDLYEAYMGRWSRLVAAEYVAWLDPPRSARWVDVGCGTGVLTRTVLDSCAPESVLGVDPSAAFVEEARRRVVDERVTFTVGDARALPVDAASVDVVVGGLVLNFVPDPVRALGSMRDAARAGGLVGAYVWDYGDGMAMLRHLFDAALEVDPDGAVEHDEGKRFPLCRPGPLRGAFEDAGLRSVEVDEVVVPTVFSDVGDYWSPFLAGQFPAPAYVSSLAPDTREALRAAVVARLPVAEDGSVPLTARAWVARGTVAA